jgi:gamma-glutamylcyclotransferase (GGCT)/AIG2-like uncharacterized protein YtfP
MSGPGGPDRLAVYGTLVPGGANAEVLAAVPGEWAAGTVVGTRHEDGWRGYPGLVLDGRGEVAVAVLRSSVLDEHLARLDAFEGPGYRRVATTVRLQGGSEVDAWVYVLAERPQ